MQNYSDLLVKATSLRAGMVRLFAAAFICFLLEGCSSNLYYVNDPVVFGHVTKKGDVNAAAGFNQGHYSHGHHFNASAAVSDKCFVIASYTDYSAVFGLSKFNGYSILGGAGFYETVSKYVRTELCGGAKYGFSINEGTTESSQFSHMKYFIQPALVLTASRFEWGIGVRTGILNFLTAHENGKPLNLQPLLFTPYMDPAVTLSAGFKSFKVGAKLSMTYFPEKPLGYQPVSSQLSTRQFKEDRLSYCLFIKVNLNWND